MRLAKAELTEKAADVGRHAMMIGAGIVFALAAVLTMAAALTLVLIEVGVVPWLAAVIAAAAMGVTAYLLAQSGITALKNKSIAPVETMHSLKETTQWLKNPEPDERRPRDRRDQERNRADAGRDERNPW